MDEESKNVVNNCGVYYDQNLVGRGARAWGKTGGVSIKTISAMRNC